MNKGNYGLFFKFELLYILNRMHLHSKFCVFVDPCWSHFWYSGAAQEAPGAAQEEPRATQEEPEAPLGAHWALVGHFRESSR